MADKSTFIKIDRNILNWRWYSNANTMRVFIHILLKSNIREKSFENITVSRGQLVTSRKSLSSELGISEQSVRTALEHLKSTNEITIQGTSKYSIITVKNYDNYQGAPDKSTNNQPTTNQQSTTIKESNKYNIYNVEQNSTSFSSEISEIVSHLNESAGTNYKPSTKATQRHISARLNEGYTVEDFKKVIDTKCSEWLNTDYSKYLRPETLFGNKFESYLNACKAKTQSEPNVQADEYAGYQEFTEEYDYQGGV